MPKKTSIIESAPSIADITSSSHRVGAVDFGTSVSARLGEAPPPAAEPDDASARADEPGEPHEHLGGLDDQTRQAAQGTGEMLEALVELMTKDLPRPQAATAATDAPRAAPSPEPSRDGDLDDLDDLDDLADRAAARVAEVAESVIASMRRVREAHERHVVALELETARRCELLTSQADLDAELIRLHARREAHAIVFAARARSDNPAAGTADDDGARHGDELDAMGEVLSRFAEAVDTIDGSDTSTDLFPGSFPGRTDPFELFDDVDDVDDLDLADDGDRVDDTLARRRLDIPRDS